MPFIDAAGSHLLRISRRLAWTEHVLAAGGRWLVPSCLVLLIVSGELLAADAASAWVRTSTLRGLHLLAAGLLLLGGAYQGLTVALAAVPRILGGSKKKPPAMRLVVPLSWSAAVRFGWWCSLAVLTASGLARYAMIRYGWAVPPFQDATLWNLIHSLTVPYFYGFLVLEASLWLGRFLPAMRAYLLRHY